MRIGLRILKRETVKCLAFDAATGVAGVQLGPLRAGRAGIAGGGSADRARAGGDRYRRAGRAVAVAGRARSAIPAGHPELGRAAGAHRGLAALDSVPLAGQRGLVAGSCVQLQTIVRMTQAARARQPYPNLRLCQMRPSATREASTRPLRSDCAGYPTAEWNQNGVACPDSKRTASASWIDPRMPLSLRVLRVASMAVAPLLPAYRRNVDPCPFRSLEVLDRGRS